MHSPVNTPATLMEKDYGSVVHRMLHNRHGSPESPGHHLWNYNLYRPAQGEDGALVQDRDSIAVLGSKGQVMDGGKDWPSHLLSPGFGSNKSS